MREPWTEARSTAIHEAGHAVVAFWCDLRIKSMHVIPTHDLLGAVTHYPPGAWFRPDIEVSDRVRIRIDKQVMTLWAGTLAEQKWSARGQGRPADIGELLQIGASYDTHALEDLADYIAMSSAESVAYAEWLRLRTQNLLAVPYWWDAVTVVADEVTARKRLSDRAVRDLISGL